MSKVDIKFVFDILDSHVEGYERELNQEILTSQEYSGRIIALENFKVALLSFIKEANKL